MTVPEGAGAIRAVSVAILLALVVGTAGVPAAGANGQDDHGVFAQTDPQIDPDGVLLSADIRGDGSASWRVEYRVRLNDDNTTAAFEEFQAAVEANESAYTARFEDRMTVTVQEAASATGREMALRAVEVDTTVEQLPRTYGVLIYTFEWTNFAAVDEDRLQAGDALTGLFLDADTSLLLSWPADYTVVEVSPTPTEQRDRSVVWRGPTDFGPGEPSIVVSTGGGPPGVDTSVVGVVVVGLVLVGGGVLWWRTRSGRPAVEGASDGRGPADRPPDELLSNEERVVALLEEHGGRMKQQDVVSTLGWTEAKTSQVVGKLRESGEIEGFRLGRENVLRLPTEEGADGSTDQPAGG